LSVLPPVLVWAPTGGKALAGHGVQAPCTPMELSSLQQAVANNLKTQEGRLQQLRTQGLDSFSPEVQQEVGRLEKQQYQLNLDGLSPEAKQRKQVIEANYNAIFGFSGRGTPSIF
ncbi:MAG: hypothetical protein ACKO34_04285, partial [Vampirovibrionales bacterium]